MGNQKFRLTDMIPNAWFYKLKDMNKPSKNTQSLSSSMLIKKHHLPPPPAPPSSPPISTMKTTPPQPELECLSRKSYHIARELNSDLPRDLDSLILLKSPPRKSKSSTKSRRSTRRSSSISSCSCQSTSTSLSCRSKSTRSPPSPLAIPETDVVVKTVDDDNNNVGYIVQDALLGGKQSILDRSRNALVAAPEHFDIVIDVDKESLRTSNNKINKFEFQLPPIITTKQETTTKPTNKNFSKKLQHHPTPLKEQRNNNSPPSRRLSVSSPGGVRLKVNSPRIIGRKQGQNGNKNGGRRSTSSKKRRSISESFAVVKSSFDPQRDFKESMVEMILQNNLTAAKDLEDLLACYLSLNSDEYHQVIIKVFKQIWFDFRTRKNPT